MYILVVIGLFCQYHSQVIGCKDSSPKYFVSSGMLNSTQLKIARYGIFGHFLALAEVWTLWVLPSSLFFQLNLLVVLKKSFPLILDLSSSFHCRCSVQLLRARVLSVTDARYYLCGSVCVHDAVSELAVCQSVFFPSTTTIMKSGIHKNKLIFARMITTKILQLSSTKRKLATPTKTKKIMNFR